MQVLQLWRDSQEDRELTKLRKNNHAPEGANFTQIIHVECKKAMRVAMQKSASSMKCCSSCNQSDATPTLTSEVLGQIAQGKYVLIRELKLILNYFILAIVQKKLSMRNRI
jgi:hypothetical protein